MDIESAQLAQQIEEEIKRVNGDKTFNQLVEMEKQAIDETITDTQKSTARLTGALIGVAIGLTAVSLVQPEFLPFAAMAGGAVLIINYSGDIIRIAKVTGEIIMDAAKPGWDRLVVAFNQAKAKSPELRTKILDAWRRASSRVGEIVQNGVSGIKNAAKSIREKGQAVANKLKRKGKNVDANIDANITADNKLQNPVLGGDITRMNNDLLQNPVLDSDRWTQARLNKIAMVCIIAIIILVVVFPSSGARTFGLTVAIGALIAASIAMRVLRARRVMADFNYEQDRALRERMDRGEDINTISIRATN
ncbi:transcription initiation factor IIB [Faustovirus]|nr:transcription initiation factor IIB [Faustovirus]QJX72827.1 transcription initiation factor IIB [Faustovirus]QJX73333.1 transcription initiation factor IIB [Faustovirus]QJX73840.1 hypothetical protein F-E9_67 [Faustovirus]